MGRWAGLGVASGAMEPPEAIADAVELVLGSEGHIADITVIPEEDPETGPGVPIGKVPLA